MTKQSQDINTNQANWLPDNMPDSIEALLQIQTLLSQAGFTIVDNHLVDESGCQISNFIAWPVREIIRTEEERQPEYEIAGFSLTKRTFLNNIILLADQLDSKYWITKKWGLRAKASGKASQIRDMIELLSVSMSITTLTPTSGWQTIEGRRCFVHVGGAIGAEGVHVDSGELAFNAKLLRYRLPQPPDNPAEAAQAMLSLLQVASASISYPLVASILLAPLGEIFRAHSDSLDFIPFLHGRSACGKSSLAALALSAFGEFDKHCFPASFCDTFASMERTLAVPKDMLAIVDDYHPRNSVEQQMMACIADQLGRMIADGNSRGRANQNTLTPQTFAIVTGEMIPDMRHSALTRFLFIEVRAEEVHYDTALAAAIDTSHLLREFTSSYIRWIGQNWDIVDMLTMEAYQNKRSEFSRIADGRVVNSIAKLSAGFTIGLTYLMELGSINEESLQRLSAEMDHCLQAIARQNLDHQTSETPSRRFIDGLVDIINQGNSCLCPRQAQRTPRNMIGFYDENYIYLLPARSYDAVNRHLTAQNQPPLLSSRLTFSELVADGIIETDGARDRNTRQIRVGNSNPDTYFIARSSIPEIVLPNDRLHQPTCA